MVPKRASCLLAQLLVALALVSPARAQDPILFPIQRELKTGFIDRQGNVVIPPQFGPLGPREIRARFFSEGLQPVPEGYEKSWGYIDSRGVVVIPFQFALAGPFSEGLAAVRVGFKEGYIDHSGRLQIALAYELAGPFSEGLASVMGDGKVGYIDKKGTLVAQFPYGIWSAELTSFSEGLAGVYQRGPKSGDPGLWGFINKTGAWVIAPRYKSITAFRNGRAAVRQDWESPVMYIDSSGRVVAGPFDEATEFSDGLALVRLPDGRIAFINPGGVVQFALDQEVYWVEPFSDGLALARVKVEATGLDRVGYIDRSGRFAIPAVYEAGGSFQNGLASVAMRGQSGYISQTGQVVGGITARSESGQRQPPPPTTLLTPEQIAQFTGYPGPFVIDASLASSANLHFGEQIWFLAVTAADRQLPPVTISLVEGGTFLSEETIGRARALAEYYEGVSRTDKQLFRPIGPTDKPLGYALELGRVPPALATEYGASVFSTDRRYEVLVTVRQGEGIRWLDDPLGWVSKVALDVSGVLFGATKP